MQLFNDLNGVSPRRNNTLTTAAHAVQSRVLDVAAPVIEGRRSKVRGSDATDSFVG